MKLELTVDQLKEAVAAFVNSQDFFSQKYPVLPEHVELCYKTTGQYEDIEFDFTGVKINLAKAKSDYEAKAKEKKK